MKTKSIILSWLLLALGSAPIWPKPSYAQGHEQLIEKILNPMPDYDPFDHATAAARSSSPMRWTKGPANS